MKAIITTTTPLADDMWLPVGGLVLPEVGETVALARKYNRTCSTCGSTGWKHMGMPPPERCDDCLGRLIRGHTIIGSGTVAEVLPIFDHHDPGLNGRDCVVAGQRPPYPPIVAFTSGRDVGVDISDHLPNGDWSAATEPCPSCESSGIIRRGEYKGFGCGQCNGTGVVRRHVIHLTDVKPVEERCLVCRMTHNPDLGRILGHRCATPDGTLGPSRPVSPHPVTPPADAGDVWEWTP